MTERTLLKSKRMVVSRACAGRVSGHTPRSPAGLWQARLHRRQCDPAQRTLRIT